MLRKKRFGQSFLLLAAVTTAVLSMAVVMSQIAYGAPKLNVKASAKVIDIKGVANISVKGVKADSISKKVYFKSSNQKVAKVNKNGEVKGLKKGAVKIAVISKKNKKIKSTIKITVKDIKPVKIVLSQKKISLNVGQTYKKLSVKASPAGVYCPVSFKSTNSKVLTVDSKGVLKAKMPGTAKVEVKSKEKNKKGKLLKAQVKVEVKDNKVLANGTWYGTGTEAYHYDSFGPDIVKVKIDNKKISGVEVIKATEDAGYEYGQNIIKFAVGLKDVSSLEKQLQERKGKAFDSVTGATLTAKGHLSAIKNAIQRSQKFNNDKKVQKVNYIDFVKRPNAQQTSGKLDLTGTVLKVFLNDGTEKQLGYKELDKYGIAISPSHGSKLPEIGTSFAVHFLNKDSLIDMPSRVQVQKLLKHCYPTHVTVSLKNNKKVEVKLDESNFRFETDVDDEVEKMEIFHKDTKLAEGKKASFDKKLWQFELKDVPLPAGDYTNWRFNTYFVTANILKHNLVSFELNLDKVKKEYTVGEAFSIKDMAIKGKDEKQEDVEYKGWEACQLAGFTSSLRDGYIFAETDTGEKEIEIRYENEKGTKLSKTFKVTVKENEDQIPAKIELYDKEKSIKEVPVSKEEFTKANGYLKIFNVEIPKEYEGKWTEDTFKAKVTNAKGKDLETSLKKFTKDSLQVNLKNYKTTYGGNGYVVLIFTYK